MHSDRSFRRVLSAVLMLACLGAPMSRGRPLSVSPMGRTRLCPWTRVRSSCRNTRLLSSPGKGHCESKADWIFRCWAKRAVDCGESPECPQYSCSGVACVAGVHGQWGDVLSAATNEVFPPGFFSDGDSSLAFDSQGRLFWTYSGGRTDNELPDILLHRSIRPRERSSPGIP